MRPERVARLVTRWARLYTRGLPDPVARRRLDEIRADLHDHVAHARADGVPERRIALALASRMLRGVAADAAWRRRQGTRSGNSVARSVLRVGLAVAAVLSLPLVAMQLTDQVVWSLGDFVVAGLLLATIGVAIELAVRRAANLAAAIGIAVLGVAAAVLGNADDAPGLVLLGLVLVGSACALGLRRAHRSR